jgi:hypothetical protein
MIVALDDVIIVVAELVVDEDVEPGDPLKGLGMHSAELH